MEMDELPDASGSCTPEPPNIHINTTVPVLAVPRVRHGALLRPNAPSIFLHPATPTSPLVNPQPSNTQQPTTPPLSPQEAPNSPMAISPQSSPVLTRRMTAGRLAFTMGPRNDCEKCRMGVKGHYAHL